MTTLISGGVQPASSTRHALGRAKRPDANADPRDQLKETAQSLQSVFVEQLFKAMRDTIPQDGLTSGGQGEDMFRTMLDQHAAELAPAQWQHAGSLSDAVVRQLSRALPAHAAPPTGATTP
ncbi:MAG: Flagellar protein FlgJ [Gemmatimonadetes bacterium]|nr:Flagellar protein FlgJ [Gemmatimonadota bacterium]